MSDTGGAAYKTVLVLLGTDCHNFDRLVGWCDDWLDRQPPGSVRCLVQYGSSSAPRRAEGVQFFGAAEIAAQIREADVVVCHGGPATITECRHAGHLPIVVPRDASFGEHVDDHQKLFAVRMNDSGLVVVAPTRERFYAALDAAMTSPESYSVPPLAELERRQARYAPSPTLSPA